MPRKSTKAIKKHIAKKLRSKTVSKIMLARHRRRGPTASGLELKVQGWLNAAGIPFQTQVPVGRCHVDLMLHERFIVEVNGCYWHKHRKCYPELTKADLRKIAKDKARYKYFRNRGFPLLLLWECDIESEGETGTINRVSEFLKSSSVC